MRKPRKFKKTLNLRGFSVLWLYRKRYDYSEKNTILAVELTRMCDTKLLFEGGKLPENLFRLCL